MEFRKPVITIEDPENLHLCFELDDKIYALNAKNVLEVTTLPLINKPQKLPNFIVGILNYNDLFINVIDIRKVFNLPEKNFALSNKVIIIKGEESLLAIIVDEVTDFFTAMPAHIQRVMGENYSSVIKSFYKIDESIINIVDIQSLEEIIKKAQFEENTTNYTDLFPQDEESICIMQRRKNEIAEIPVMNLDTAVYGKDQYIVFRLADHTYCIYSYYVRELINLKNFAITKIPYTPDFIIGIINLKGNFYSLLDLKKFIGIEEHPDIKNNKGNKVIIIESTELKLALLVDDITNIVNISPENIEIKNDKRLDSLFIKAEAYIDREIYNILNLEKLINDERLYIDNTTESSY